MTQGRRIEIAQPNNYAKTAHNYSPVTQAGNTVARQKALQQRNTASKQHCNTSSQVFAHTFRTNTTTPKQKIKRRTQT